MAPYQYDPYVNRHAAGIAGTLREMGDIRARAAMQAADAQARATAQRGDVWGQAIGQIGQAIGSIPAQMQQAERNKAAAREDMMRAKVLQGQVAGQEREAALQGGRAAAMKRTSRAEVLESLKGDPEGYKMATEHFQRLDDNVNRTMGTAAAGVRAFKDSPQAAIAALDDLMDKGFDEKRLTALRMQIVERPEAVTQLVDSLLAKSPDDDHRKMMTAAAKPVALQERDPTKDIWNPQTGQIVAKGTPKAEPREPNVTEAQLAMMAARGDVQADRALQKLRAQKDKPDAQEPLVPIMGPDGPVLVRRSQAEGKRPANTREQGRPVTSGDASDLADFDTSLDELKAVRAAISPADSTGIVSRVGATIPYVTQITGWGADAKKRQAVIDRVKQVIGKTLEGGVLRKEDEAKYEKILPNIGDEPSVAASKLDGLDAAIATRKQRRLDALEDANYDVSKYAARPSAAPPKTAEPVKVGGFTVKVKP